MEGVRHRLGRPRVLAWTLAVVMFLPMLLASSASSNDERCAWPQKPVATFGVADATGLFQRIPRFGRAPELTPLHDMRVTAYACYPFDLIPIIGGPFMTQPPSFVRGLVIVEFDNDALWYSDVDLRGLVT